MNEVVDRMVDEVSWKFQLEDEEMFMEEEEGAKEYDQDKVLDREHWWLHQIQQIPVMNATTFDREIFEHEQERRKRVLASRGLDVEKIVKGLKRKLLIQINKPKPKLPEKQNPE